MERITEQQKSKYNNEPVFYCSNCSSLSIIVEDDIEYCNKCGCTDIIESTIEEWEKINK